MKAVIFVSILLACVYGLFAENENINGQEDFQRSKRQIVGGASCVGQAIINGQVTYSFNAPGGFFPSGTLASGFCNPGFFLAGTPEAICQNGQWSPPALGPCNPANVPGIGPALGVQQPGGAVCGTIPVPINGQIEYSTRTINLAQYLPGAEAVLYCNVGGVSGSDLTQCQNGVWNPPLGSCVGTNVGGTFNGGIGHGIGGVGVGGAQCLGGPLTPLNGQLRYSTGSIIGPWPPGAVAMLICSPGYFPAGTIESICINGQFNPLGECILGGRNIGGGFIERPFWF
uniref:Sushi domain-containing protein n=1 Tax=Panagrolaimus davidi TaxID=227884 RepID=A0A914Q1G9_9BILA